MSHLINAWYQGRWWLKLLAPLEFLSRVYTRYKRRSFLASRQQLWQPPVPVIVVGNITVGGTGKTPLVKNLVELLQQAGYRPGIISRGYGATIDSFPCAIPEDATAGTYGDEPVMLAEECQVPVVIDPDRSRAAKYLLDTTDCNLILSDDGMQHYRLERHIEIAVLDGQRLLGNGQLLPMGPLREEPSRLATVDFVIVNGKPAHDLEWPFDEMQLVPDQLVNLATMASVPFDQVPFYGKKVHVVAGIGNPSRVFRTVSELGFEVEAHPFSDHHPFKAEDFSLLGEYPVIMTSKDAVKCRSFATDNYWALTVRAELGRDFQKRLLARLDELKLAS